VWISYFGSPKSGSFVSFPYKATSPTLFKKILFDYNEVWKEFNRIGEEAERSKWTVGQSMFYQLPLCANMELFLDDTYQDYIREYIMVQKFNIPAAKSLEEAEWHRIKYFEFIEDELNACHKRDAEDRKK
tara:strand:- start:3130 stop:3519 length:390 start_codon:yes stop_codon:yes gene_type:complete